MAPHLLKGPFTVEVFQRLGGLGVLREDDRVELIAGQVVEMTPIGDRHASCVRRLNRLFAQRLLDVAVIDVQDPPAPTSPPPATPTTSSGWRAPARARRAHLHRARSRRPAVRLQPRAAGTGGPLEPRHLGGAARRRVYPSGTTGYDDLARHAVRFEVYGVALLAARLEDIIRSKEAAGRPQDRQDVVVMREMLKRRPPKG